MAEHANLTAALAAAQAEYPTIVKGSVNPHFKSTYADLADGMGPIRPILAKHGIAYTQTFHVADGILLLRTSLRHGAEEIASDIPISQPPKPQDFVALTTYYRRVALFSIAGITPENEDDDGQAANEVATTQAPPRQPRQPQRQPQARPLSPQDEVERAIGAKVTPINRPTEDADPWRLASLPAEDVADLMVEEIGKRSWAEGKAAVKHYLGRGLTLTEYEEGLVSAALKKRHEDEKQQNLLAAG